MAIEVGQDDDSLGNGDAELGFLEARDEIDDAPMAQSVTWSAMIVIARLESERSSKPASV